MPHDYEILLMLDPDLPEGRPDEIIARTRELIENGGGTWVGHDPWGRRRLAYEIDKKQDGVYHLLQFDAEPETLDELTRILKITDGVMRHLPTRRIKGAQRPGRPGPEPVESVSRETEYSAANVRSQEAPPVAETPVAEAPPTEAPEIEAPVIEAPAPSLEEEE